MCAVPPPTPATTRQRQSMIDALEPFIAPDKTRHGPALHGRIPSRLSPRDRMLQTRRGRQRSLFEW